MLSRFGCMDGPLIELLDSTLFSWKYRKTWLHELAILMDYQIFWSLPLSKVDWFCHGKIRYSISWRWGAKVIVVVKMWTCVIVPHQVELCQIFLLHWSKVVSLGVQFPLHVALILLSVCFTGTYYNNNVVMWQFYLLVLYPW